ncbi:MAG: 5-(carboxyamino)imidazole ribonucleotide synthase, partial [Candidatus Dadabacteria bacterium]|nr:5-(carboxyamino)imidazole ribonucleotide synthase [Candidatus Dadabacteria bacterium]
FTSQYEQCLRSIFDLPPGNTEIKTPSVMINILGQPGFEGDVRYQGFRGCMGVLGAKFHIYGKTQTKPYRKMGHVTVLDDDIERALEKAKFIMGNLRSIA